MRSSWIVIVAFSLTTAPLVGRAASYQDDIGYTRLKSEQGGSTPDGTGVSVTQVEAPATNTPTADDYFPDTTDPTFSGKTITPDSSPYSTSSHATTVGRYFYGTGYSVASGITSINVYNANTWNYDEFLNTGSASLLPDYTTDRVANHSYVGYDTLPDNVTFDPVGTLDNLHRLDYVIQHDDYINVVAVNNPGGSSQPILADSFNAISVGLTDGTAASGTTGELDDPQGLYVAGRAAPDVVGPTDATSFATPMVASTAAILVELAHDNPSLSAGSFVSPRTGLTLEYGETADVIKAAIMAGADRVTNNTSWPNQIGNYGAAGNQTQNGLDTRYGAGQLDVYNSYHIIAAGQQAPGTIGTYGFDYNPSSSDTSTEDYTFSGHYGVAATLAWNIHIDDSLSATLANFQLKLYQVTGGSTLIASSVSTIDNTQNIYFNGLNSADTYELEITRTDSLGNWDYGLAWDLAPAPEPGTGIVLIVGMMAMLQRRNRL